MQQQDHRLYPHDNKWWRNGLCHNSSGENWVCLCRNILVYIIAFGFINHRVLLKSPYVMRLLAEAHVGKQQNRELEHHMRCSIKQMNNSFIMKGTQFESEKLPPSPPLSYNKPSREAPVESNSSVFQVVPGDQRRGFANISIDQGHSQHEQIALLVEQGSPTGQK